MSSSNGSSISSVPSSRSGSFRGTERAGGAIDGTLEALGFPSTRAAFTPDSLPPVSTLDWPLTLSETQHSPLRSSSFSAVGTFRATGAGAVGAEMPSTRSDNVRRALNSELWPAGTSSSGAVATTSSDLYVGSRQSVPDLTLTRASTAEPLGTLKLPLESDALSVTSASSSSGFRSDASGVRITGELNMFAGGAGFAVRDWSAGTTPRLNTNVTIVEPPPASPNFSIDQLLGSSVAAAILATPGHLKGLPSTPGNESAGSSSRTS